MKIPSNWIEDYSYDDSVAILKGLAGLHANQAGPFREELNSALSRNDFSWICDHEPCYATDCIPDHYRHYRQALGFFQKLEPLEIGRDKESVAFAKFVEAEEQCRAANLRLEQMRRGDFDISPNVAAILHGAIRKIASVLGDVPQYGDLDFRFGPGANTSVKARVASPRYKLGAPLACSSELANSVESLLAHAPHWGSSHCPEDVTEYYILHSDPESITLDSYSSVSVEIHNGMLQFVPKNAKTYRSIVIEPILNSFAQKGVGTYLKRKLRESGVDLRDQERNKRLAWKGSISNCLATVDLSSASDTISREVVATLLPLDWYSFLSRFRTGRVEYKGAVIALEKFSSMGNAFTFELETLIFWSLAMSVCEHLKLGTNDVATYGDDIILPTAGYSLLVEVLQFLGFSVNTRKSFVDGPFRESCGADWYLGHDIRPYYQRKLVTAESLFVLHNFYMRHFDFEMAQEVLQYIHPSLQLFGPDGYGDGHLIGSYSVFQRTKFRERGYGGVLFETFTHKKRRLKGYLPGDRVLPVYAAYVSEADADILTCSAKVDHNTVRGSAGYRRMAIYTLATGVFLR